MRVAIVSSLLALAGCAGSGSPLSPPGNARAERPAAAPRVVAEAVGCIGMTVSNLERTSDLFERVLTFRRVADSLLEGPSLEALEGIRGARVRRRRLELGGECVELSEPLNGVRRAVPADSKSNDRWFQHIAIVVRDIDAAYARLEQNQVAHISPLPQTLPAWNQSAAGIRAYYFKDPDGHALELIWFPPDKGQPRWHAPGTELFMGIDHTAIASSDTDASLAFYVGKLGFRVAGGSENSGVEQERLSGVPGARVRITTLRVERGPGIELLDYLTPRDGRPTPRDERADDLVHWRTVLYARGARSSESLRDPDYHLVEIEPR